MPEPQARRDQREITVPARGRELRPGTRRRAIGAPPPPEGIAANLSALALSSARLALRRPGTVFGSLLAAGAAMVISMNALGYQMGRHPAPIFPKVASPRPPAARLVAAKPAVESPPQGESAKSEKADPVRSEAVKPARADDPPARGSRDSIGEMIRAGETTASVTPKSEASVAQAQRALAKLGYGPLKADGVLGAGTRAAIEKFERDRKLPVKGEASGRTLRELAARAGIPPG